MSKNIEFSRKFKKKYPNTNKQICTAGTIEEAADAITQKQIKKLCENTVPQDPTKEMLRETKRPHIRNDKKSSASSATNPLIQSIQNQS